MCAGVRGVDHVRALRGVGHPQRDPQVGVGPDLRRHHAGRAAGWPGAGGCPANGPAARCSTRPVTKSGRSRTIDANSSITISSRGSGAASRGLAARPAGRCSPRCPWRPPPARMCSRRVSSADSEASARSTRCGVEVGDHADGVRQLHAVLERAAALVVDEHERHRVRPVGDRQRGHDRLQQLGLAGAGGAGDQPVRAVAAQVDAERAVVGLADHGQRGPAAGARQRAAIAPASAARGRARRAGRLDSGSPAPSSSSLMSLIGAQAAGQPRRTSPAADAASGRTAASMVGRAHLLHPQPVRAAATATAWHSAGSSRSSASRQIAYTPTGGPSRSSWMHAGQRAQPPRAVEARPRCRPAGTAPRRRRTRRCAFCRSADDRQQLGDPAADRSPRRCRSARRVLRRRRAGQCGSQRAHSQLVLPGGVGEHAELHVVGAVQGRDLGHQPAAERPRRVARARRRRPRRARAAGRSTGASGICQTTCRRCSSCGRGRCSSTADGRSAVPTPEQQVVGVGAAPLPQPAPRAGRDRQHRGRVGRWPPPRRPARRSARPRRPARSGPCAPGTRPSAAA